MGFRIPETHPLRRLFSLLVERNFREAVGWPEPSVMGYLSNLLTDFTHIDNVYRIKNAKGKRVEEVAEMLLEGDVMHRASSFDREREVHKHIGDYTLFMTGIFPEYLKRLRESPGLATADALLDYVRTGKRSYYIVSEFIYGPYRDTAPLFRRLSDNFELCIFGLSYVRKDLDRLKNPALRKVMGILLD